MVSPGGVRRCCGTARRAPGAWMGKITFANRQRSETQSTLVNNPGDIWPPSNASDPNRGDNSLAILRKLSRNFAHLSTGPAQNGQNSLILNQSGTFARPFGSLLASTAPFWSSAMLWPLLEEQLDNLATNTRGLGNWAEQWGNNSFAPWLMPIHRRGPYA